MKARVSGCISTVLLVSIALIVAYAVRPIWLPLIGQALEISSELKSADVIIVLGGGLGDRERYASDLFHQGMALHLIATGAPLGSQTGAAAMVALGVPREAIVLANGTLSTHGDALRSRQIMEERGWHSALLVTDPYHIRRSLWSFRSTFQGTSLTVSPAAVVDSWFRADDWWQSVAGFVAVNEEYVKLAYYILRGYVSPAAITVK